VLSLHRMRSQIVKIRTMQAHQVRSLIYEFGSHRAEGLACASRSGRSAAGG